MRLQSGGEREVLATDITRIGSLICVHAKKVKIRKFDFNKSIFHKDRTKYRSCLRCVLRSANLRLQCEHS